MKSAMCESITPGGCENLSMTKMKNLKAEIGRRINKAIKERVFPGCVVGVVNTHGDRVILPYGSFTYEDISHVVEEDSIFNVASITKVIPTTSLILYLIDQNKISPEDRLINFIPEIKSKYKSEIKIKHLISQTLYYETGAQLSKLKDRTPSEILDYVVDFELSYKPGKFYSSVNTNSILLTVIIEKVFNNSLDNVAERILFHPLDMKNTTFHPLEKFNKNQIVPTEYDEWRKKLVHGEVHDESTWVISKEKVVGASGLFSNAPDLLNFLEMLLNKGNYNKKTIFKASTVELIYKRTGISDIANSGLGWDLNRKVYMGKHSGRYTIGKTGFTGTCIICDVPREVGFVILSNYVYPKRKPDSKIRNELFRDISDIIFDNL